MQNKTGARTYIAIDLKSFYASVECVERGLDPLTTNLVVADASRTEKTICLAVTPSLKAYGLSGRSRLFEVVQKVKEIKRTTGKTIEYITAVPRMALYIEYSARIYEIYLKYFSPDDIHVYSIDEVFIDATSYIALYKRDAKTLASKVIEDILSNTGVTATAGIAPNLFLCKIAMDIEAKHIAPDKNGVRIAAMDEKTFREKMWNHKPLTDFWRIGKGTERRLNTNGMYTMGDVARRSIKNIDSLYRIFGIDAEILIDHAWGYEPCTIKDIKNYKSANNSLGSGQVLSCPYTTDKARIVVQEMTERLVLDLVNKKLAAPSFTIFVGYDASSLDNIDLDTYDGDLQEDRYGKIVPKAAAGTAKFGAATSSTNKIIEGILNIYDNVVDKRFLVRRLNITANNITKQEHEQAELFIDVKDQEKEKSIQHTILSIQEKFGKNAILKGTSYEEGATARERNNQIGGHKA